MSKLGFAVDQRAWLAALGAAWLVSGCSTDGAFFITETEEYEVGQQVDQQIRTEFEVCSAATCGQTTMSYVSNLGQQLAAVSDRPDANYSFTVLNSPQVNAFAAPGGFIYITTELILQANSTAEVAGVLAHEIGHIVERHGAEQMEASLGFDILEQLVFGNDPGIAADIASTVWGGYQSFSLSKDKELEADYHGVVVAARGGFSPNGITSFFETLQVLYGDPGAIENALSSHPAPSERIKNAGQIIANEGLVASQYALDGSPPLEQVKADLVASLNAVGASSVE